MTTSAYLTLHQPGHPLYLGSGITTEIPVGFVAIDGIVYPIDWTVGIRPQSIPQTRQTVDTSARGRGSMNPDDLWRYDQESWHQGAGQAFLDREDSEPYRFRSSKGFDPFTEPFQLTLLNDTEEKRDSANTNLALAVGNSKLYVADGNEVRYLTDVVTAPWSTTDTTIQAGEAAQSVQSITTDGHNLYAALGSNGVHRSVNGASATHYNDLAATLVRWAKGRLMAAATASLYNITASGAAPAALMAHDNSDFRWQDVTGGKAYIFAGGFSGLHSEIWKTAVKADGTALDTPSPAGELTDGEVLRSLKGYQGLVLIGTDDGIRLAVEGDDGNLTIGALIDLGVSVRSFEPEGPYVWFTWTNYDGTSTGLGRLDLRSILPDGAPAYASDLMATEQGTVLSVATFSSKRVFAVSGKGFYAQTDDKVASATIDSGYVDLGVPEKKSGMFVDVRHHSTGLGSVTPALSVDGGDFNSLAGSSSGTGVRSGTGQSAGELFEVRLSATRATNTELGPTITRWAFLGEPRGTSTYLLRVPILLTTAVQIGGTRVPRNPDDDFDRLATLLETGKITTLQRRGTTQSVKVQGFEGAMDTELVDRNPESPHLLGTVVVVLKVF